LASWQDLVFTVGAIVFFASLLPTALGSAKPPVLTSLPTGVLLLLFSVTYASLGLTVSAVVTVPSGLLWLLIAAQGLAARRRGRIDLNRRPTEENQASPIRVREPVIPKSAGVARRSLTRRRR
jgi:hypothetical protein